MRLKYTSPRLRVIEFHPGGLCDPSPIIETDDDERAPQGAPKKGLNYFGEENYWDNNDDE